MRRRGTGRGSPETSNISSQAVQERPVSVLFWRLFVAISVFVLISFSFLYLTIVTPTENSQNRTPCVLWMAPFLSGGGYSSEAWSYVTSLRDEKSFRTKIEHHGDMQNFDFWNGLSSETKNLAYHLHSTECGTNETIVICHSEPGAWWPPLFKTNPCPPTGYEDPLYVIGRTMFETDRLNSEHARRCNRMDSVWVPTDFHISTFVNSGVDPSKLLKINQPVDVEFFNPDRHDPLPLPCENPVFGDPSPDSCRGKFVFLSIFKWEKRKGWDLLLKAYLTEFSDKDDVVLYLLTNPYHSDRDFTTQIQRLVDGDLKDSNLGNLAKSFHAYPPIQIIDTHIPETDLPGLYKSADVFVLPAVLEKAKQLDIPKEIVDRNLNRALEKGQEAYIEKIYEVYGFGGVSMVVDVTTDKITRSVQAVRQVIKESGAKMADSGSAMFKFRRARVVNVKLADVDKDKLLAIALDSGAEDVIEPTIDDDDPEEDTSGCYYKVVCSSDEYPIILSKLREEGIDFEPDNGYELLPLATVEVDDEAMEMNKELVTKLLDIDDVDAVYTDQNE